MIFAYNKEQVGDVCWLSWKILRTSNVAQNVKVKWRVSQLMKQARLFAWNIFEVSSLVTIEGVGQVTLSDQDVATLNAELTKEGFSEQLENEPSPKFVVGQIKEMVAHPDSDHLNICQVQISDDKIVQIVAGAPNAAVGLKTIVALPGAMMPNGSLIFPGALRGEKSFGMMCSPRELVLPTPHKKTWYHRT